MTSSQTTAPQHAIARAVAAMDEQVDNVLDAPVWSMSDDEAAAALVGLTRLISRITELEARVAVHASSVEVGSSVGATSMQAWWATQTSQTHRSTAAKIHLAEALGRWHLVRQAVSSGALLTEQAQVIVRALDDLPEDVDPETRVLAEKHLVDLAADHDAIDLRRLGRGLLDVIDPAAGEDEERRRLEEEERRARQKMRLTMSEDGHGSCHGRFTIPAAQGAMLKKILQGIAAPKHQTAVHGPGVERKPSPERMGAALCELIERYPADRLPNAGGVNATVVITMPLEILLGAEKAATLDTGDKITASQARRLACEAGIIPAVLGGKSEVLDLGRTRRYFSKAQHLALGIEQGGCTADGCDWPPSMCHAHHDPFWSHGGNTDLKDGRLLCPRHHARAHDPAYEMAKLPGGKVAFTRRT
ncbi:HNH endonuclease signature motif containing protein [Nocardioides luti]